MALDMVQEGQHHSLFISWQGGVPCCRATACSLQVAGRSAVWQITHAEQLLPHVVQEEADGADRGVSDDYVVARSEKEALTKAQQQ